MADIFISYKREDRRFAERLSIALEQLGFDVWWDFDLLSGDRYRNVIRAVIDKCPAAIVLWSTKAVESDFVMDEATFAKSQGKLCPALLDGVEIPFGFGQIHTDNLADWDGELSHPGFQALVRAVETRVGRKGRLGAVRQSADAQAQTSELEAFKVAQLANNASALKSFLNAYPRGMFSAFVRGQLETIEAHATHGHGAAPLPPAPQPAPPPEPKRMHGWQEPMPAPSPTPVPTPTPTPKPWGLIAGAAGLALIAFIALAPKKPGLTGMPGDLSFESVPADLKDADPSVREAVMRARDAEKKANAAAASARAAASRAQASGAQNPTNGEGIATYSGGTSNGDSYAGQFKEGLRDGHGVMTFANNSGRKFNGLRYEGQYANGKVNGHGIMMWRDGDSYAGSEREGLMTGPGVYRFADGRRFEGDWVGDKENGYGIFWTADGKLSKAGVFANNELTSPLGPQGN